MSTSTHVVTLAHEYLEYAVRDIEQSSKLFERMGFNCVGKRTEPGRRSKLYMQGDIRFVLTASSTESDPAYQFAHKHGDGVCSIGYLVPDATEAYQIATKKGAKGAFQTKHIRGADGVTQHRAAIHVYGDVVNEFISYDGGKGTHEALFTEDQRPLDSHKGRYVQTVDHVTVNVEKGQVETWTKFFADIFDFSLVRQFDIRTDKTGLFSNAIRNPNGRVTMPFNEPTDPKSQIQEFVDTFHGPGVQHIALHTSNIILCLEEMIRQKFDFLAVPQSYYEAIPTRVPNVVEDMNILKRLNILIDGSPKGYLLQIFTQPVIGPFFFEFIQRKGDNGFGDGNFRALFEAIERDQIRRGVL